MFGNKQAKVEKKQYSISQEEVAEIAKLAEGQWLAQKMFKYIFSGFNQEINNTQKNIVARLSIDTEKFDVDWSTLFKDGKIYTLPKAKVVKQEDKEPANA